MIEIEPRWMESGKVLANRLKTKMFFAAILVLPNNRLSCSV